MLCKHCQNYIPEDSRFCPKCGVRLRSEPAQAPPWLWICTILLFAVIWATHVRQDFKTQLLILRAQVIESVIKPLSSL